MTPLLWKCGMWLLPIIGFQSGYSLLYNLTIQPEVSLGFREDSANWNIPGGEGQANILSELSWKDLRMVQLGGRVRVLSQGNLYLRGNGDYAWILHGINQDSDYLGDNRTMERSRSVNDASKGETYDVSAALGLELIRHPSFSFAPVVGYAYSQQHLHMFDGKQMICLNHPEKEGEQIEGLDSTYHNRWKGPFVGVDVRITMGNWKLSAEWERHWTRFIGKGNWNLRRDLYNEFFDRANGHGTRTNVRLSYQIFQGISLGCGVDYWDFHAQDGKSEVQLPVTYHNVYGDPYKTVWEWCEFGFNEVNWHSIRVNANLSFCF